jgi:hypothetical protein
MPVIRGVALVGAFVLAGAGAPSARADGRLATYPLVYRLTSATTEDPVFKYVVFFHTRGAFIGHDDVGTSVPGTIDLEDSTDSHDGLGVLPPAASHCYIWSLGESRALARKRVGDHVRVKFALRGTPREARSVTLRRAPTRLSRDDKPWYRTGGVARRLAWIGC